MAKALPGKEDVTKEASKKLDREVPEDGKSTDCRCILCQPTRKEGKVPC